LEKEEVRAIVCSHLHFDHCGGNAAFPGVPVWVQAAEREAANTPKYTIPAFVEDPGIMYRLIDGGVELLATQAFETMAEFETALADGSLAARYPGIARLVPALVRVHVSHDERIWTAA